ncbi:MAG: aminoacyl-tRNA hydrolase [Schleiferiaceae bacterium]|jgi:PTH1 family peptidyl-tRNA hydrolase
MKKFLMVGLGNPGPEYAQTRHNIGFDIVDAWAQASTSVFSPARYADRAELKLKGRQVILIKPTTFMNLSGKAVRYWMEEEKIPLENVVIILDELALEIGKVRLKTKGSDGGHNGLKDIQAVLGRQDYARLRFGIGQHFPKGQQVDFVLGKWQATEMEFITPGVERAIKLLETFVLAGPQMAMNQYNQ